MAFVAGQKLRVSDLSGTASGGGGGTIASNTVFMSSAVTVNNTTTVTDATGLSVAVLASATYKFDGWIIYTSNTTADFKLQPSSPSGTTGDWSMVGYGRDVSPAADTGLGGLWLGADIGSSLTTAGDSTGTASLVCRVSGLFITSTTAGTFKLRFAQRTANASNTVCKARSWMDVVRIA